uniref:MFS transporter n=1 Tax=Halomonas sp. TaxID=1486246 RepID=UPI0026145B45|nr:MFS transporter [Halomonas sp.]
MNNDKASKPLAGFSGGIQRLRMQVFAITWLAYAAFYFTRKSFSVAKLGFEDDPSFIIDKATMAQMDALYLAAYAIGQFAWGVAADRFGPRVVVFGGLIISALAAIMMGTMATLPIFASCMVIQGLAQSTGWSGLCKNLSSFFTTQERGRVLGLWSSCYAFGGLVASPFAGWWAYHIFGSWRFAFFSSAIVVLGVALLFLLLQRNRPQDAGYPALVDENRPAGASTRNSVAGNGWLSSLKEVMQSRTILVLGLCYFLLKPARYALLFWGPLMVYERMPQIGKMAAVIIPTSFEVAGLFGPILVGFVSDKLFRAKRFPACALSLILLAIMLMLFVPAMNSGNVILVVTILFVIGLTLYGPDSMISGAAAVDFGGRSAATASGFVNGCGSVGAILGGILPGFFDSQSVFMFFTAMALVAMLLTASRWNLRPTPLPA